VGCKRKTGGQAGDLPRTEGGVGRVLVFPGDSPFRTYFPTVSRVFRERGIDVWQKCAVAVPAAVGYKVALRPPHTSRRQVPLQRLEPVNAPVFPVHGPRSRAHKHTDHLVATLLGMYGQDRLCDLSSADGIQYVVYYQLEKSWPNTANGRTAGQTLRIVEQLA
jgi:hypothetical protein